MFFSQESRFPKQKADNRTFYLPNSTLNTKGAPKIVGNNSSERLDFSQELHRGVLVKGRSDKVDKFIEYSPNLDVIKTRVSKNIVTHKAQRFSLIPGTQPGLDSPGPMYNTTENGTFNNKRPQSAGKYSFGSSPRNLDAKIVSDECLIYSSRSEYWCSPTPISAESADRALKAVTKRTPRSIITGRSPEKVVYTPGPGSYDVAKSSLNRQGVAPLKPESPSTRPNIPAPGPGEYYHEPTLVRKTFNKRIFQPASTPPPTTVAISGRSRSKSITPENSTQDLESKVKRPVSAAAVMSGSRLNNGISQRSEIRAFGAAVDSNDSVDAESHHGSGNHALGSEVDSPVSHQHNAVTQEAAGPTLNNISTLSDDYDTY